MFRFSFDRWSLVVMVCMKIHNLCINESCAVPTRRYAEDIREGDEWVVLDNMRCTGYGVLVNAGDKSQLLWNTTV